MEQITLFYQQGSSDKVYQAHLAPMEGGYVVRFAYGRRGSTLQTGTKTNEPVPHQQAKRIYDQLVNEKLAKGYTPGEDGTPYQHTVNAERFTGIECQLLNPVAEEEVQRLLNDPAFAMQEKFDGRRTLIRKNGKAEGINRKGLLIALPEPLVSAAAKMPSDCILDGECMGDQFIAFDALQIDKTDIRPWSYKKRLFAMNQLLIGAGDSLVSVTTAVDSASKVNLFQRLREQRSEGVVFKRLDAPYSPGRPSSGGDQLKYKFVESASFLVDSVNAKRSISLKLLRGKSFVSAGNVTIPPNHEIPAVASVVEVRYLYAFPESGCIYQPVYLGTREDVDPAECLVSQLKYKPEASVATG
jgi:bifunctional non-homologous end joining protein LigD